jgi:thioredoxin 1
MVDCMRKPLFFCQIVLITLLLSVTVYAEEPMEIPVKNMVTMVDLGAHKCIPCKMMAPILTKLTKEYEGKAAIIFIDVWEDNSQGSKFGIKSIPTQIFFDREGKEVYRHQGFMAEDAIVAQLDKMGAKLSIKE